MNDKQSTPEGKAGLREEAQTLAAMLRAWVREGHYVTEPIALSKIMQIADVLDRLSRKLPISEKIDTVPRALAYSGAGSDSEILYSDLARMYLAERNAAHAVIQNAAPQVLPKASGNDGIADASTAPSPAVAAPGISPDKRETPRTDALEKHYDATDFLTNEEYDAVYDLARQLERELAEEKARVERIW